MKTDCFIVLRVFLWTLLVTIGFTVAHPCRSSETDDEASAAFKEGLSLFHEKQFDAAAAAFRKAQTLRPNWKILYNLGQSEAAAKRYGLALEAFEKYLVLGGDDIEKSRRDEVLEEVDKFRRIVGSVEIRGMDGLVITIDNVNRGTTPLSGPLLVAAGIEHQLTASKGDDVVFATQVRVNGEQQTALTIPADNATASPPAVTVPEVSTQPEPTTDTAPSPVQKSRRSVLKPLGWSLAGIGGVCLIAAAATGATALSLDNEIKGECSAGGCPPDKIDTRNRMESLALSTDILIGAGAALAATGIILGVVGIVKDKKQTARAATVVPLMTPSAAGLIWVKEF